MTWAIAYGLIGLGFGLFLGFAASEYREREVTVEFRGNSEPKVQRELNKAHRKGQVAKL